MSMGAIAQKIVSADANRRTGWSEWLVSLLAYELARRPRRIRTSLRMATIATIGAGLMAACHVQNVLGTYVVWLMLGASPMMSVRTAAGFLIVEAAVLAASVPVAGIFSETPWLMLAFVGWFTATITYLNVSRKLGTLGLVLEVVTLDTFYGVMFAPNTFGWSVASVFAGCTIAFGLITLFDNWIWPDPAEAILLESLTNTVEHNHSRLRQVTAFYLYGGEKPIEPPAASQMPAQLVLLDRAAAEGITPRRRAVLLAAITRSVRVHIVIDRLIVAAREDVPRDALIAVRPELQAAVDAIGAALDEIASGMKTTIRTGPDTPPSPAATRVTQAIKALDDRIIEARPSYINRIGVAELANMGAFTDGLHTIARLIERPLDAPPAAAPGSAAPQPPSESKTDPALLRYCAKTALCLVIGYVAGLASQHAELSVVLTTVIITALPTYGASLRKMILRIVGTIIGGVVAIAAIIIVTPNFETLPSYMIATFIVLAISAYASLSSGRVAYAGKSIGTTFVLVFAGISPSEAIYEPLWRSWGILLGTVIVTVVFIVLWPEYAADSLLPRMRKVIRDTASLAPDGAVMSETDIHAANTEITRLLGEILEVADDARLEGRKSLIDHDAIVQAAGTLRRIAHRLAAISIDSIVNPPPALSAQAGAARAAVLAAIRMRLQSWLSFYEGADSLSRHAAESVASEQYRYDIRGPLDEYSRLIERGGFTEISNWRLEQRRLVLAELNSLRRLDFLIGELDSYLSVVPGGEPGPFRSLEMLTPGAQPD